METKTKVIVLRTTKLGDTKIIVDTYARTEGRISFVTSLPRSGRGRVKKQLFQALAQLSVTADIRPRLSLQKLREAQFATPYTTLHTDPYKICIAMFLAEFLSDSLRSEAPDSRLFDYISDSLLWLDNCGERGFANFHLVFLMHLSRFLGFYPNLSGYHPGDAFDLRAGCFISGLPAHADVLRSDDASRVALMMRMDYPTMHLFRMSRTDRNRLLDIILSYYAIHIPGFRPLKSLEVLRDMSE